jgi:hypothetical protein
MKHKRKLTKKKLIFYSFVFIVLMWFSWPLISFLSEKHHSLYHIDLTVDNVASDVTATETSSIPKFNHNLRLLSQKLDIITHGNTREVIITTATKGFHEMLLNWMCSLRRLNLLDRVLIYVTNKEFGIDLVNKYKIPEHQLVIEPDDMINDVLKYKTLNYQRLMAKRTQFIDQVLNLNYTILLADNDAIWMQNPIEFIRKEYANKSFDLLAQNDNMKTNSSQICGGFIYMKPTTNMKALWHSVAKKHTHLVMNEQQYLITEQVLLNQFLKSSGAILIYLPTEYYPSGYFMFKEFKPEEKKRVHVIHNNWIVGTQKKIERFKQYNIWWLLDSDEKDTSSNYRFSCKYTEFLALQ